MSLEVAIISCLSDNYSYICSDENKNAFVVDPSEFGPINDYLIKKNLNLEYILNTHHHFDHVGGNIDLKNLYNAKVIGNIKDKNRIPEIDIYLADEDIWTFHGYETKIIDTPGHTVGHIVFHFKSENILFTGDTLFSLGCGRLFEGTPQMMWGSLKKLKSLPDETKIYCGHEYTENNAKFLNSIYVNNLLTEKINQLKKIRKNNVPSIPTTLSEEKKLNLFLQADKQEIKNILNMPLSSSEEVFTKLRSLKDNF